MLAIKIQCGCGQRYSFEVEPAGGRMPHAVACPICGADGTSAANQALAQNLPAQSAMAAAPALASASALNSASALAAAPALAVASGTGSRLNRGVTETAVSESTPTNTSAPTTGGIRLSNAPSTAHEAPDAVRRNIARTMQVDPNQAEHEARAKIMWGDPVNDVIRYLMGQGFTTQQASTVVQALFEERAVTIRKNGFKKIGFGIALMCVPVIGWFVFMSIGYIEYKIFGGLVMVGLYGGYLFLKGMIMAISPKTEPGDVSSQ